MSTPCPLCKQSVQVPSLPDVIATYRLTGNEAAVLEAVWSGRGLPVQTERIFDAMFADDPDGGPPPARMYRAFKSALHRLNNRLDSFGISIKPVGFRRGYRLALSPKQPQSMTRDPS